MKLSNPFTLLCAFLGIALFAHSAALTEQEIPGPLKEWEGWATWDAKHRDCPTPFNDAGKHVCFWPGELAMAVDQKSATWELGVTVFSRTWVPLPGDAELWPIDVTLNGSPLAVVEHDGKPSVELEPGEHRIAGSFRWEEMPQQIRIPREVGILSLAFEGSKVDLPNWDESGNLWLKRTRVEATDKDAIAAQVWSVIEDGIPLWLRTEIELSVSGKSREEVLGNVVPEGWSIASVKAPIPVAVDDNGLMKAQVRAGKWTIAVDAFRTTNAPEIKFAEDAHPVTATELVGFRARPEFRAAELEGLTQVDVSQTTFPEKWRNLPVYQWPTDQTIHLVEKMRGMGFQKPEGLKISRVFWLDENGGGLTFRDQINGAMQQIWRLDIAEGEELGSVKIGGQSQLITRDPASGAPGVEIRARNLNLQAIGRTGDVKEIPATGWRTPSDGLNVTMNLPPGWRLFALFGADWVRGDWLTSWTLLDLFLLLIFSLAVFRLFGWKAGIVAFLAFGLSYHEPGAPHYTWLFLLFPLALLRVVPEGGARKWIQAIRYIAIALLLLCLVPFVAKQIQSALYPQLEAQGFSYGARSLMGRVMMVDRIQAQAPVARENLPAEEAAPEVRPAIKSDFASSLDSSNVNQQGRAQLESNLFYESKSKIQTGPAEPEWNWNTVSCGWNGPVSADEKIRPVFISLTLHRILTILRVALLVWLGSILLRSNARSRRIKGGTTAATVGLLLTLLAPAQSIAQLPDQEMLDTLRQRLLETSDAFPHAAEIPSVDLKLTDGAISTSAVVHTAVKVAVPMPGKLPSWSPVSVTIDDSPASVVRRDDGYLWVVVPEGVHRVTVEGLLPATTEWAWTFLLKPRRVSIDAPGWTVTGVRQNGVPENQIFFARQRESTEGEAEYDRKDFKAIVAVERNFEIGLVWQLRTVVKRLSPPGKAVSLRVPLLTGEKVLTSGAVVKDGFVEVQLGAGDTEFSWESELPVGETISLTAEETDRWVERWQLITSPVWNVTLDGLAPVFETNEQNLVPVWHPWPGESVTLSFSKPEALSGDTMTIRNVDHTISLGSRQRTSKLQLNVEASLGDDFVLELDPAAEISSLTQDNRAIPVRRDGANLIVPVHPGTQILNVEWSTTEPLKASAKAGRIQLPVEAANINTTINVPANRWILWTAGPLRGPAVRFWTILVVSILAALVLGRLKLSPLRRFEWVLLAVGLTQVHAAAALLVVGWFFLLSWRGRRAGAMKPWIFDLLQILLVGATLVALVILVTAVKEGLLGSPEMFIRGNGSSRTSLNWFQARSGDVLPMPHVFSVSIWFYRFLMLAWALWLAAALLRWLKWGWSQFSDGGCWRRSPKKTKSAPPLPQSGN